MGTLTPWQNKLLRDNSETTAMTIGEIFAPLTAALRIIFSIFGRGPAYPHKRLQAQLIMRGIVSELPDDIPLHICDEKGQCYKGVYVIGLLIWNKGNQPVVNSDFIESAPLQVRVGQDASLVVHPAINKPIDIA